MTPYEALMKCYPLTLDDLPDEVWKELLGYQVSTYGRVKSFKRGGIKILKPDVNRKGYLFVALYKNGKRTFFKIHRLVALAFVPNPENKPQVNHIDGNKLNNFVGNLEWVTNSQNQQHAFDIGLCKSRINKAQAEYIRANPDNLTTTELGKMFGVNSAQISRIQMGNRHKTAGGSIRDKIDRRVPDDIRNQIKAEYQAGVRGCGSHALAKRFDISYQTILRIVRES